MPTTRLRIAAIGGGNRVQVMFGRAARQPNDYEIVAVAECFPERRAALRAMSGNPGFREFADDSTILAEPRLADLMIIGTQDAMHFAHASGALKRGYDLLLEKPIAASVRDVLTLERLASSLGRRVLICHVLRYTAFYRKIRALVAEGAVGELVSFEATQGLDPWHQAHSYVRGHWAMAEKSTPLTVANACHDLDIISWLVDSPCTTVSSFGGLMHFNAAHAPKDAPVRCTDGCPAAEACLYDAHRYLSDKKPFWLGLVFDRAETASDTEITDWLKTSKWGRCAYRCDNTTVDHQTINMQFASGVTGSFTLTGFSIGRDLALFGTKGRLLAGPRIKRTAGCDILVEDFKSDRLQRITLEPDVDADTALMRDVPVELRRPNPADMLTSLQRSVDSHLIGFAAEESRLERRTIDLAEFRRRHA